MTVAEETNTIARLLQTKDHVLLSRVSWQSLSFPGVPIGELARFLRMAF